MRLIFFFSCCSILFFSCKQKETADTIYYNAMIWTGDSSNPEASSIAIKQNEIIYVGDDAMALKGSNTKMVDLNRQMLVPGFGDNHTHFLFGGYSLESVQLKNATTKQQFINDIKNFVKAHPGTNWIQGGNWDHEGWGGELPQKEWIDSVTGDRPLYITRYDGHVAFANSKALAMAGIHKNTATPTGGEIVHDAKGEPTGVVKDEAMSLFDKIIPPPTNEELDAYLKRATQHAVENGVTLVNDVSFYGGFPELETYRRAYQKNELPVRVYSFVPLREWKKLNDYVTKNGKGDDYLKWGGLKGFVDGSLGAATAWFYQPYVSNANSTGLIITDTTLLHNWVLGADSAGLHVTVHAIGDRAIDFILNTFEEAQLKKKADHRFRVEHAQHLSKQSIERFAALHVIASVQPYHLVDDGNWAFKRIDEDRLKRTYAFNSLLSNHAMVTFGSDWTVAPLNPLEGIYAAVTRKTGDGKNPTGWFPEQKITVEQALRCYTSNNAFASFLENKTGMLKQGMLADFVVLSKNLFTITPDEIRNTNVQLTVVNGKEVYKRSQ